MSDSGDEFDQEQTALVKYDRALLGANELAELIIRNVLSGDEEEE